MGCWRDMLGMRWQELTELAGYLEHEEAREEARMIRAGTFGAWTREKREEHAARLNRILEGGMSEREKEDREKSKQTAARINIMIMEKFY